MTAKEIISALVRKRYLRVGVMPNFTPFKWWECDVCELTKSGYMREYEVKVSRGDFFQDCNKGREPLRRWNPQTRQDDLIPQKGKHDLLAEGSERGPVQFWYVVPKGLVTLEEVPAWAGLIEICEASSSNSRLAEYESKKAPRLHRAKAPTDLQIDFYRAGYFRFVLNWVRLRQRDVIAEMSTIPEGQLT